MKHAMLAILTLGCVWSGAEAVEREQLSAELQALLPPANHVQVRPKTGEPVMGEVVERTDERIVLRIERRGVSSQRTFPMSEVEQVQTPDYATIAAGRLLEFRLDPKRSLPPETIAAARALMEEFLLHFPDHARADAIRERLDEVVEESARLASGMEKIDGRWLGPVQAAVVKYDRAELLIAGLRKQHSGIEQPGFAGPAAAKRQHDQLVQFQRDTARTLPQTMTGRMPKLLREQRFDEGAEETAAFVKFWLQRVLRTEAGGLLGGEAEALRGMDFQYLIRMQLQILDAWKTQTPPPAGAGTENMARIPAGFFMMGDPEAGPTQDTFPAHLVWVDAFLLDRAEVTNAEYRKFVEYVKSTADSSMAHPDAPPLKDHTPRGWAHPELAGDDQPVVGVDWFDAYAYARWSGKRLPTEAEWEKAARGTTLHVYPWGDAPPNERYVNNPSGRTLVGMDIDLSRPPPPEPKRTLLGGTPDPPPRPPPTFIPPTPWPARAELPPQADGEKIEREAKNARGPHGLLHLAGNAAEWVADVYDPQYYRVSPVRNPQGPPDGRHRVFRGGSYLDDDAALRLTCRGNAGAHDQLRQGNSVQGQPMIGFRCAQSLPAGPEPAPEPDPTPEPQGE
jgi:formylglycine-generating enzyme required for sulfatase activity